MLNVFWMEKIGVVFDCGPAGGVERSELFLEAVGHRLGPLLCLGETMFPSTGWTHQCQSSREFPVGILLIMKSVLSASDGRFPLKRPLNNCSTVPSANIE